MKLVEDKASPFSPRTQEILGRIVDAPLRADMEASVTEALAALSALGRLHLPQDHFEEHEARAADDKHLELAPYVLAAVAGINRLLEVLGDRFPPPAESQDAPADDSAFDFEFDLVDGPTGEGSGLAAKKEEAAAAPSVPRNFLRVTFAILC